MNSLLIDLKKNADTNTVFGMSIVKAINENKDVIGFVKSQANDNPKLMAQIIGEKLTNRILAL